MFFIQQKSKGLAITLSFILGALFSVGVLGLIFWLLISRILEIHVAVAEYTNERHTINLANVLISHKKLAYEYEGKIIRGILDSEKIEKVFVKEEEFLSNIFSPTQETIDVGYPNSVAIVRIVDLEECSNEKCKSWVTNLYGPISIQGLHVVKYLNCLKEHIKIDQGLIFRLTFTGLLGFWQPLDLANCVANNIPPTIKAFFTKQQIAYQGLPVLIKYPDGRLHVGRIFVVLSEFL